ncbi:MAG: hypothetical protein HXY49_01495 [Ignavibacteriaceae bacterium]|nr:hypothetical protein [Ignavibacteriaceae bacterium]
MSEEDIKISNENIFWRITAIWGFSEALLGGVLHALKFPFTGIFIGGTAVILISLLARYTENNYSILKATGVVIIVKGLISPHTPITAYAAVSLQGLIGFILFSFKSFPKISALLLGIFSLLLSGVQKILILTIVFGNTLWKSIDLFINYILVEIFRFHSINPDTEFSNIIIISYMLIHLAAGILIGLLAGILPVMLSKESYKAIPLKETKDENLFNQIYARKRKHKRWYKRVSAIIFLFMAFSLLVISFFYAPYGKNVFYEILFMIARSVLILIVWYYIFSPFLIKWFKRIMNKRMNSYASEIENIISLFPLFRNIVSFHWKSTNQLKGLGRIKTFLYASLLSLIREEIN